MIDTFWTWFASVAPDLADRLDDRALLAELDRRVHELGPVSWELGPGRAQPCQLVITPDGDREQLALTRAIVAAAPAAPGWELHSARPPKDWQLRFRIEGIEFDASAWRYRLYAFEDGTFDIDIWAPAIGARYRKLAAAIVLDAELGEARRLELIGGITVLDETPPSGTNRIRELSDHLIALKRN